MQLNRRLFLKAMSLVGAAAVFGKELFARPSVVETFNQADDLFARPVDPRANEQGTKPIFKVTGIDETIGLESIPHAFEPNDDGYLCFAERFCTHTQRVADRYAVYAPMPGFERTGPWFLWRTVSRREARRARFTIAVSAYTVNDLAPKFCPGNISLPSPAPGQTYWAIYSGSGPAPPASVLIDISESARVL